MRRSLARFSGLEISIRTSADFITNTCGFRFSVHTGVERTDAYSHVPLREASSKNCSGNHYNGSGGHDSSCEPTHTSQNALNGEFSHNVFV